MLAVNSFCRHSVEADKELVICVQPIRKPVALPEQIGGLRFYRFGDLGAFADALADSANVGIQNE